MEKSENNLTIHEAQKQVDNWIKSYGVRYFSELTNLAILMEEVGELSRLISRTYGEQSFKQSDKINSIPSEMGDILFVLICMANQMDISLEDALKQTLKKNTERDKDRHKENKKLK
ncbi:MAG: pyrophosphatase [Spirochaetia bacterium]|nr:pyrophosphatase [Spirochaetia bacterium]